MSRAYRIQVRESLKQVLKAHDKVSTQVEILEILPGEQMAQLLAEELERRGFRRQGKILARSQGGVTVNVDPESGTVTVKAEAAQQVKVEGQKEGRVYDDMGPSGSRARAALKEELRKELARQVDGREAELQAEVTGRLEASLGDLRKELDQAVNRVTAEALKQKASQLGQIKQVTEDPQAGSLTIVLEV